MTFSRHGQLIIVMIAPTSRSASKTLTNSAWLIYQCTSTDDCLLMMKQILFLVQGLKSWSTSRIRIWRLMGGRLTVADGGIDLLCHKKERKIHVIISNAFMFCLCVVNVHMTLYIICLEFLLWVQILHFEMHLSSPVFSNTSRAPARRYIHHQQCYGYDWLWCQLLGADLLLDLEFRQDLIGQNIRVT